MTTSMLPLARRIADRVEARATDLGLRISLAVVDAHGNLVLFHRMDGATLVSVDIAPRKAYTAVALGRPTAELTDDVLPGGPTFGLNAVNGGRYVSFGGGIPFLVDGELAGAIGVSGASSAEDIEIGQGALEDVGLA